MKRVVLLSLFTISFFQISAQKWVDMMLDPKANFYDIKKEFDAYWKDQPYERGHGYKQFLRWAHMVEPRVYPSGNMENASRAKAYEEFQKYLLAQPHGKYQTATPSSTTANWTPLGPYGSPVNGDAGRLQCIRFMPGNSNIIFVGTAAGGLWRSVDNGATWTTNTDQLPSLGVSDIAVVPTNTNVMYLATGDNDAGDTKSVGVLKSTDGGNTWNTTGLSWAVMQANKIARLLTNPLNANEVIAATSIGVYRTLNAGVTWSLTLSGGFTDAEYRPGDTTTIYVCGGGNFYKSTNGGASFSGVALPFSQFLNRTAIAVTPADQNYVYVLGSDNSNGFGGLYLSNNSATSFTIMSNTPNIFDWSTNGSGTGGQGWYDLAIGASPTNKNEIICSGVNTWKSTDAGVNWTLNTHWYGGGGKPYVHADCHDIIYVNGTTCYAGTDGGIARTTNGGTTWTTINGTMNISQQYRMGLSASSPSVIITGHQDNGSNLLNGTTWTEVYGGDGMDCFVDWGNNNNLVASIYYGAFYFSNDGGANFSQITNGLSGSADWIAPIVQDPLSQTVFYCGYEQVFKTNSQGASWTQLGTINGGGPIKHIAVSPSNTNYIYAARFSSLFKTNNGGITWGNITSNLPVGTAEITGIAIDNTNPNNVYITLSGYSAGNKVFYSNNGGATWTNYSTGLPNIHTNCIVYQKNSPGIVYVGTDLGVYYREMSMGSWIPFMAGLPNVIVDDLEIYYPTKKLRAATYGRGTWETDLYSNPGAPPTAFFTNSYKSACINVPFQFKDVSSNSPTSWAWSFPGGSPASSTVQIPSVTYTATGIYTITLVSTNTVGTSTPYTETISVFNPPTATSVNDSICIGSVGSPTVNTNATLITWPDGQTGPTPLFTPTVTTAYNYTAAIGACEVIGSATVVATPVPPTPTVVITGSVLTCNFAAGYQWYFNGGPILGATGQSYTITSDGWYSVWVDNGFGCKASLTPFFVSLSGIKEFVVFSGLEISPNPAKDALNIGFKAGFDKEVSYNINNMFGQTLKSGKIVPLKGEKNRLFLDGLTDGAYILSLSSDEISVKYKFIKQ